MDNAKFWKLYDSNEVNIKVYEFKQPHQTVEVDAFEYDNKFYLRIVINGESYVLDRTAECGKKYRMNPHYCYIKEFNNRNTANKYFLAIKKGGSK